MPLSESSEAFYVAGRVLRAFRGAEGPGALQGVIKVSVAPSLHLSSYRLNFRADGQRDSELRTSPLCTLQCHPTSVSFDDRFDKA